MTGINNTHGINPHTFIGWFEDDAAADNFLLDLDLASNTSVFYWNTTTDCFRYYDGTDWQSWCSNTTPGSEYSAFTLVSDADYTVTSDDWMVMETGMTADRVITLPSALIATEGWRVRIRNDTNGGNDLEIATEGAETIDGHANYEFIGVDGIVELISDGTNMIVIDEV